MANIVQDGGDTQYHLVDSKENTGSNGIHKEKADPDSEPKPKTTNRICKFKACREWGNVCVEAAQEIQRGCEACDCRRCMKNCCSVKRLKDKLPIIKWLPKYRLPHFQGDLIAGLTVGLTVIPQGLAYAQIAELPPQYGLYSAFMGCFIYFLLGTAKDITLGPTAIMSLMTAEFGHSWFHNDPSVAIFLTFFSGLIQLAMGLLHIGFLVEYISYPVINSFTTAAAITIAFGQIKKWLGLKNIPRAFLQQVYYTFKYLPQTKIWDFVLGLVVMIILYGMKRLKMVKWNNGPYSVGQRIGIKTIWLFATARNAIIVILSAAVAAILLKFGIDELSLTGTIKSGFPPFRPPPFSVTDGNITYTTSDMFSRIGSGFGIVPVIGLIETIAIGKAFARKNNYVIDANQELIAIGAANVLGAFVSSYPVTGSFSRTAVNSQSGVRTPAGGLWTAGLVLLALGVLTPLFAYIPDAALAGVIIMAVLDMASFDLLLKLWRIKRLDLIPWLITFIFSFVLGIEYGIILGVAMSLLFLLYPWARPAVKVRHEESGPTVSVNTEGVSQRQVVVVQLNSGLRFPGIEFVKERVLKEALRDGLTKPVVLDCSHVADVDYSTVQGLIGLFEDLKVLGIVLVLADMQPPVLRTLQHAEVPSLRYADTVDEAINIIYEEAEPEEDNPHQGLLSGQLSSQSQPLSHSNSSINGITKMMPNSDNDSNGSSNVSVDIPENSEDEQEQ